MQDVHTGTASELQYGNLIASWRTLQSTAFMSEAEESFLRRRRKFGIGVACALGGVGLGLTLVAVPFVLPALRRYCLPYVPATPEHIQYVLLQLKGRTGRVVDLGSGDGRLVCPYPHINIQP